MLKHLFETTNNQCLICFNNSTYCMPVENMQSYYKFNFTCDCNALYHEKCLVDWNSIKSRCPTCHKYFYINVLYNKNSIDKIKAHILNLIFLIGFILNLIFLIGFILNVCIIINTAIEFVKAIHQY